ncbi:MAG: hypothetical protein A4E63_02322 [Syntrophorhabdus sp. PtaU1.Bin050]|nr:MAG: hypothetical protein A4E63_02322 [Syntrophorhabdus sp. PtaU1.Bin050]
MFCYLIMTSLFLLYRLVLLFSNVKALTKFSVNEIPCGGPRLRGFPLTWFST